MRIEDLTKNVNFGTQGTQPQTFAEDEHLKVILAGLEAGQTIPVHPEGSSVYYFLEGSGRMHVDGTVIAVTKGVTVIMPKGAKRGLEADTRLVFLAAAATA